MLMLADSTSTGFARPPSQATYLTSALDLEGLVPIWAKGGSLRAGFDRSGVDLERGGAGLGDVTGISRNLSWPRKPLLCRTL